MCHALAEAGARVAVAGRNVEKAGETCALLPTVADGSHLPIALDHFDEASMERGVATVLETCGSVDILVNNGHEPIGDDWTTVSGEQFTRQLANASGYFLLSRLVRNAAVERRRTASVVMLGSMYGSVASYPDVYEGICAASPAAYHALKGGILHLTRHLAVYWAADGIRVNCLSPGPFPSPSANPDMVERIVAKSPMKRIGQPHELKGAVVFLASDASSYITGQNLIVDGGWTAW